MRANIGDFLQATIVQRHIPKPMYTKTVHLNYLLVAVMKGPYCGTVNSVRGNFMLSSALTS